MPRMVRGRGLPFRRWHVVHLVTLKLGEQRGGAKEESGRDFVRQAGYTGSGLLFGRFFESAPKQGTWGPRRRSYGNISGNYARMSLGFLEPHSPPPTFFFTENKVLRSQLRSLTRTEFLSYVLLL